MAKRFSIKYKLREGDSYENLLERFGDALAEAGIKSKEDLKNKKEFVLGADTKEAAVALQQKDLEYQRNINKGIRSKNAATFDTFWKQYGNDIMAQYGRDLTPEYAAKFKDRLRREYVSGSNSIQRLHDRAAQIQKEFWNGTFSNATAKQDMVHNAKEIQKNPTGANLRTVGYDNSGLQVKGQADIEKQLGRPLTESERKQVASHYDDYQSFRKLGKGNTYQDYLKYLEGEHKSAESTRDLTLTAGQGILAGTLATHPVIGGIVARKILPGIAAKKTSAKALDYTNLDEDTKNTISSGIGFGVGFGSGNLLTRAAKGAGDFLMYQKAYRPIAANIVGDNLAADIVAGGVQGIGKAAFNSLSHEGLTMANNLLQKSTASQALKHKGYQTFGKIADNVGNQRILAEFPTKLSEVPIQALSGTVSSIEHGLKGMAHSVIPATSMYGINQGIQELGLNSTIDPDVLESLQTAAMVYGPRAVRKTLNKTNYGDNSGRKYLHQATEGQAGLIDPLKSIFTGKYKNYDATYNVAKTHSAVGDGNYAAQKSNGLGLLNLIYKGEAPQKSINGVNQHGVLREGWIVPERAGVEYDAYQLNQKLWGGRTAARRLKGQKWALISPMDKTSYQQGLRDAMGENFKGVNSGDPIIGLTNGINHVGLPLYNYYNGRGHLGSESFYADKGGSGSGARFAPQEGQSRLKAAGKGVLQTVAQGLMARPLDYGAEQQPLFFSRVKAIRGNAKATNNGDNVMSVGAEGNYMPIFSPERVASMKQVYYDNLAKTKTPQNIEAYNKNKTELESLKGMKGKDATKRRKTLTKKIKDYETIVNQESYVNGLKIGGKFLGINSYGL